MVDKLLSYTAHDGEGESTIQLSISLPLGDMGMGKHSCDKHSKGAFHKQGQTIQQSRN